MPKRTEPAVESPVIVLKPDDYAGCLNLQASEKILILEAYIRFQGHRLLMSRSLGMSERNMYRRIRAHGLENYLESKASTELLWQLEKEYPLITLSNKEFGKIYQ